MIDSTYIDVRIEKCQKILETDPNSQIFAALAEAYRKKGEFEKAFRICQSGLRIHPSYGSAHLVMAKINLDRGLYDWAEAEINKAIAIDGNSRVIELLLAEIYIYRGEFDAAIKLLRRLHQSDPNNDQIKKLLEIALKIPSELDVGMSGSGTGRQKISKAVIEKAVNVEAASAPSLTAHQVVSRAVAIPDIQAALFINPDGLPGDSEWSIPLDPTVCAASIAELDRFLTQERVRILFGAGKTIMLESIGPLLYMVHVNGGSFLFACDKKINLGTLRTKIAALTDGYVS
ncbi:MAG: tetratricopeptide repeat protein [candidate division Zixibacteria bacterium]|nr:tetratricopeptide repeat protein [candidate division Zixibacteria bacterium]